MDAKPVAAPSIASPPLSSGTGVWRRLTVAALGGRPDSAFPRLWREKKTIIVLLVVSALVQVNAVLHDGAKGQDYPGLFNVSVLLASDFSRFDELGGQDPPVFFYLNAVMVRLTGHVHSEAVCGLFNLLVNCGALWVFYALSRRFVASAVWRVTLFALVAFLPVRLIHAVVLSSDALTMWPFFALAALLVALTDPACPEARRRWIALGAGGLLALGVMIKYTFMSSLVAVFLTVLQLARRKVTSWWEAVLLWTLLLFLPLSLVYAQQKLHPDFTGAMAISYYTPDLMSYRDVVWVHSRDKHIFDAPRYDEPIHVAADYPPNPEVPYELLQPHGYSYPALTHLGIFTDVLNIFQYDPSDAYFGARSERNQRLMAVAVKTAAPITLTCMGAVALLSILAITTGLLAPARSRADLEAVYLLGFGWFSNIVVFLPFVTMPYEAGFWLPRLTLPGLLLFLMFTVYLLERLLPGGAVGRIAAWVALAYVVCQSALQVSYLWPWGVM